jgi:hypothetical protein
MLRHDSVMKDRRSLVRTVEAVRSPFKGVVLHCEAATVLATSLSRPSPTGGLRPALTWTRRERVRRQRRRAGPSSSNSSAVNKGHEGRPPHIAAYSSCLLRLGYGDGTFDITSVMPRIPWPSEHILSFAPLRQQSSYTPP